MKHIECVCKHTNTLIRCYDTKVAVLCLVLLHMSQFQTSATKIFITLDIFVLFYRYNDVNNQQNAMFSFINLFNSALHVSGDKFAYPQEHFLIVYTAFGTVYRNCCRTVPPVGSSIGALYQNCIYSRKVLLRIGEFVARNM